MKNANPVSFVIRMAVYCLGLFVLALGVSISVNSNLGVSPVSSLPYVVSRITNLPLGSCVTAVFCSYILIQILIQRREFQIINLLQIAFSTIFGYFVDVTNLLVGDFVIPTYFGKLLMLAMSIALIALGILLYMDAGLVPMPMEGLTASLAKKLRKSFPAMKTTVDCIVVGTGVVLSFVFLGKLEGIREGTIITAMLAGKLLAILRKLLSPFIRKLCFGQ